MINIIFLSFLCATATQLPPRRLLFKTHSRNILAAVPPKTQEQQILAAFKDTYIPGGGRKIPMATAMGWDQRSAELCNQQWDGWKGIRCDDHKRVTEITIEVQTLLSGPVSFSQLPETITYIDLTSNQLTGTINLSQLPKALRRLKLGNNKFSGNIDLTKLPESLVFLDLSFNCLS
eukprot:814511_1